MNADSSAQACGEFTLSVTQNLLFCAPSGWLVDCFRALVPRSSKITTVAACIALLPLEVLGQKLSVGVVAGGSPTSAFRDEFVPYESIPGYTSSFIGSRFFSQSKDFIVGGMLEWHFNPVWSVEGDGLFRQLHMTFAAVLRDGFLNSVSPSPVVTWEFPVLAKYRLHGRSVDQFIEAGPSFRTAGNLNGTNPSHLGITAGLGIEMHWRGFKIAPSARYTRWASDKALYRPQTSPNQVELMVGFSRQSESSWRPLGHRASLGIVMGTNLTGDFRTTTQALGQDPFGPPGSPASIIQSSGPRSMIVGPAVDFKLPYSLSVEVDALYRPISGASETIYSDGTRNRSTGSYVTWEFPVLAKYTFRVRGLEPFIALGPSFRRPQSLTGASPYGVATGTGVMFQRRHMGITPSIRYTHWAPDQPWVSGGAVRNQTELLVGLSF